MPRLLPFLTLLLFSLSSFSQGLTNVQKLDSLCKMWGFLKYYHPAVLKNDIDMDRELVKHIPMVLAANDNKELNKLYLNWIDSLDEVKHCKKCVNSVSLSVRLEEIRQNRSHKINYNSAKGRLSSMVSFEDRQVYPDMAFPNMEYRLLSLFRFWNFINYYFPYKVDIGEDWNDVLKEMIPRFMNVSDTVEYHLLLAELVAGINDSHSGYTDSFILQNRGWKMAPFGIKIIDEKAVVTGFYNDSLSRTDDVRYGDAIISVDGKMIAEIIKERSVYTCASNTPRKLLCIGWYLFFGKSDSIRIVFDRDGKMYEKTIRRYRINDLMLDWETWWNITYADTNRMTRIINNRIGYINMGLLQRKDVKPVMKQMKKMDAIIFDLRNYPNKTARKIACYLGSERKPNALIYVPAKGNPGVFRQEMQYAGKKNFHPYEGKVVILTNELTISLSEYSCMIIQAVVPATVIGSQTAGADGTIALFTFPGGEQIAFSSIGIYYPDGRKTQRIGIVPDIKVEQTLEGIRNHRDEILEKAIEYVTSVTNVANEK